MTNPSRSSSPGRLLRQCIAVFGSLGIIAATTLAPLPAAANGDISKGFAVSDSSDIGVGSLMSLSSATDNKATAANTGNSTHLLGIVGETTTLEFGNNKQVQIITSGIVSGLVSDINGSIKSGDRITASPVNGVGMRATDSTLVVGVAQGDLNLDTAKSQEITDKNGSKQTIHVGSIPVQVNVGYYSATQDRLASFIPPFLFSVGKSISGNEVSPLRILACLLVLALGFITITVMLQTGIHSGIIAIGRNPLAQTALRKGLLEVVLTALGTLVLTIIVMYLLLSY